MKIYVWGTGVAVGKVVGKHIELEQIEAFIDNDCTKHEYMGKKVYQPEQIVNQEYDAILVANLYGQEIYNQCIELNFNMKKIIFLYGNIQLHDINKDYDFVTRILGAEYSKIVQDRYRLIRKVEMSDKSNVLEQMGGEYDRDYVRIKCFDLAVKEIYKRNIQGAVAEFGVFRGEFARFINGAFPDRKCYLFDTFEGFDANEALHEKEKGNGTIGDIEALKQTSAEYVLSRMPYVNNVVIKQGLFPKSLEGLEETFAFVSLDVDLEDSTYEGLKYFYPRLTRGGYIFIHDYNSEFRGVEKAVDRYEADYNVFLCKMPLCDPKVTLVVMKA